MLNLPELKIIQLVAILVEQKIFVMVNLKRLLLETDSFKDIVSDFDFLKIDIEGYEAEVLLSTNSEDWINTDAMIEVGSPKIERIFNFFKDLDVNLFAQKKNWLKS